MTYRPENQPIPTTLFDSQAIVQHAQHPQTETAEKKKPAKSKKDKAIQLAEMASSAAYLERFVNSPDYATDEQKKDMLWFDFYHLIQELVLSRLVTTFSYTIENQDMTGDGYLENMDTMHANFVQAIQEKGLNSSRSVVEYIVFQRLKQKLVTRAQERTSDQSWQQLRFVLTSPPDDQTAGYHGSDSKHHWSAPESHHSFIYVYQIDQATDESISVTTQQFRTWHNMQGLVQLHHQLGADFTPDKNIPLPNQLFANVIELEFPAETTAAEINQYFDQQLYDHQDNWVFKTNQVPELIDLPGFEQECRTLFDQFFAPRALSIYRQANPEMLTHRPQDVARLVKQVDLLVSHYLAAIQNRVRDLNQNPIYEQTVRRQLLKNMLKKPWRIPQLIKQYRHQPNNLTLPERLPTLQRLHTYDEQIKIFGQKLSADDQRWYNQNASQMLSLANFVFGSAQCVVLTPFTAPLTAIKEAAKLGSLDQIGSVVGSLSSVSRLELFELLTSQEYVELRLPGANQVWMVPRSYLDPPGCRVDADGRVIGPCDLYLDDPRETLAMPMDQVAFNQFLAQLGQEVQETELADIEKQMVASQTTPANRQKAHQLFADLKKLLIKPSIGVQDLINNTMLNPVIAYHAQWREIIHQLKQASNPFVTLNAIVEQLIASAPESLANTV